MRRFAIAVLALSLAACSTSVLEEADKQLPEATGTFNLSEPVTFDLSQSYVSFLGKSSIVNHEGEFETYDVRLDLDDTTPSDLTKARFTATIDIASVKTDAEGLTNHLQKADFFDAAAHPQITFASTSVESKGGTQYAINGDLTVKGKTLPVTIDAEITDTYILATFEVPRAEFGVGNASYGEKLLEDTVPVEAKLVFAK